MVWRRLGLLLVLAALNFVACGDTQPENVVTREVMVTRLVTAVPGEIVEICTLMGCSNSLTVTLTGNVPATFDLTVAGQEASCMAGDWVSGHAGPGTACHRLVLPWPTEDMPTSLTIVAAWGEQEISATAVPAFATLQPNGPNCDPICLQGEAIFIFP